MKQTIELNIPQQLQMLCELLETTPQQILQGFINDMSLEAGSNGSDERRMAVEYFMRCGYGMHRYEFEEVEQMFDGLNWLRWQQYEKKGAAFKALQKQFLKEWFNEWQAKMKSGQWPGFFLFNWKEKNIMPYLYPVKKNGLFKTGI